MPEPLLPPPTFVADPESLAILVETLASYPIVAVDTESNSLHAYRERVCLIQFSIPTADYVVDPIALKDLTPLASIFANPTQQKVFHAAEYDIICLRRDYRFDVTNIFDTMIAARTLGWPQLGLAPILDTNFGVKLNKKHQSADWRRRPLTADQLDYARMDTHYLAVLRERQLQALEESGRSEEAHEEFERLTRLGDRTDEPAGSAAGFWRIKGARDLSPAQAAVLEAVFAYREQQAERLDRPPFKVMGADTLMALARLGPRRAEDLQGVPGMTPDQMRRHATDLLAAISRGLAAPAQFAPAIDRDPEDVRDRYDRLHTWRKNKAKARGVESDVILPRTALWDLARRPPRTPDELAQIADFGPWRRKMYGDEILALLSRVG